MSYLGVSLPSPPTHLEEITDSATGGTKSADTMRLVNEEIAAVLLLDLQNSGKVAHFSCFALVFEENHISPGCISIRREYHVAPVLHCIIREYHIIREDSTFLLFT